MIVVVGAGIAGLTAARMLLEAGWSVRVISDQGPAASQVPVALVNPVRGKRAVVLPQAAEALEMAWRFYGRFTRLYPGILRPLGSAQRIEWQERLAGLALPHVWRPQGLFLPGGFWLQTDSLLVALRQGFELTVGRVVAGSAQGVYLADGRYLPAWGLVWAGGAAGAALTGLAGRFTAGSVIQTDSWQEQAVSSGGYAAGDTVGSTYLPHRLAYEPHQTQPAERAQLADQAQRLLGYCPVVQSAWAGVRYRTGEPYLRQLVPRVWALTGWGSGGYFYAPLAAAQLVRQLGQPRGA